MEIYTLIWFTLLGVIVHASKDSTGRCDLSNAKRHPDRPWEYVYCGPADSWNEANNTCASANMDGGGGKVLKLPRIYNKEDVNFILNVVMNTSSANMPFFLGVHRPISDVAVGSDWEWLVGFDDRKIHHWENRAYRRPPELGYTETSVCAVHWTDNSWEYRDCDAAWKEEVHVVCGREIADDKLTCDDSPCFFNSICDEPEAFSTGGLQFQCTCQEGMTGKRCEKQINFCEQTLENEQLCEYGYCQNEPSNFKCYCDNGYTGIHCQKEIDECASGPCQNGAACEDLLDNFRCNCSEGFRGKYCAEDIDECASNPCENLGSCIDGVASYECLCAEGFQGGNCQHVLPKTPSPIEDKVLSMEKRMAHVDKKVDSQFKYTYVNLYAVAMLILVVVAYVLGKIRRKSCKKQNHDYDRLGRSSNRDVSSYTNMQGYQGSQGSLASTPTYQSIPDNGSLPRQQQTPVVAVMTQNAAHYSSTDISARSQATPIPPPPLACRPPPARRSGRSISTNCTETYEIPVHTNMNAVQLASPIRHQRRPSLPSILISDRIPSDYLF